MTVPRLPRSARLAARWLLNHPAGWAYPPPRHAEGCRWLSAAALVEDGAIGMYRIQHGARAPLEAAVAASEPPRGWVVLARAGDLASARAPASRERAACVWWSREEAERVALDVGGAVVAVELAEVEL